MSTRSLNLLQSLLPIPIAAVVATLVLLLSGCGADPTAGGDSALRGGATIVRVHHPSTATCTPSPAGPAALRFLLGPRATLPR
jgi:hypothetical protein